VKVDEEKASDSPGAAPDGMDGAAAPPEQAKPTGHQAATGQPEPNEGATPDPSVFDALGQLLPASSFAPGLDDAALGFPQGAPHSGPICDWCGAALPARDLDTCPSCGAALKPPPDLPDIPGLTVAPVDIRAVVRDVSPEIRALVAPPVTDELAIPGTRPELGPPDPAIRRAMLEMELEARPVPPEPDAQGAEAAQDAPAAEDAPSAASGHDPTD
jgi:hypothetical protein